jgi:hypothetical protein
VLQVQLTQAEVVELQAAVVLAVQLAVQVVLEL